MKISELFDKQSECLDHLDKIAGCIHDHGVVELPENDADSLLKYLSWVHEFITETIRNTEVFK